LTQGTLFVVGTPIGNLGDITIRAQQTLQAVVAVAAEDTRRTRALLTAFGIRGKRLISLDAHASAGNLRAVLRQLQGGQSVALVTDSGMPSVSDPGARLVRAASDQGVTVAVVPGPSAVTAAIALSGLVQGPFLFIGFLPRRGQKRSSAIARIAATREPVVLLEAPRRAASTVSELAAEMPSRPACVCRELTKIHEEVRRGLLSELAQVERYRGEITIVLGPADNPSSQLPHFSEDGLDRCIRQRLDRGGATKTIAAELSAQLGIPRRELYARVQALRKRDEEGLPGG